MNYIPIIQLSPINIFEPIDVAIIIEFSPICTQSPILIGIDPYFLIIISVIK